MIYFDHNATSPCRPEVFEAMREASLATFANPASTHDAGVQAAYFLEEARYRIAALLGAQAEDLVITSGGTESNALALRGRVMHLRRSGEQPQRVIASELEHHAVLWMFEAMEREGLVRFDRLRALPSGQIDLEHLRDLLRAPAQIVAVMLSNNESGVIQPIAEAAQLCKQHGAELHIDAVQGPGKLAFDFAGSGAATAALSAHKFGGPKGVGLLIKRQGYQLAPLMQGGSQETGLRPGTHNVPGVLGMAKALELASGELGGLAPRLRGWRDQLGRALIERVPGLLINGDQRLCVPNTLNVSLPGASGSQLVRQLSDAGIAASAGSACTASNQLVTSHVLRAMGCNEARAAGSLRFSMGWSTTEDELDQALSVIPEVLRCALE